MHPRLDVNAEGEEGFDALAERFVGHYETLRGVVRRVLLEKQLSLHLPPVPASIVDVGGGAGHQAIPLARRGYHVTLVDPSEAMLTKASSRLDREQADVRARVALLKSTGEDAPAIFEATGFDVVMCHAVLPYVADPAPLLDAVAVMTKPGGVVSLVAKNADALAMRPALEGRFEDAVDAFDAGEDVGGMGVSTRAHRIDDLIRLLSARSIRVSAWYGIRVFTDHVGAQAPGADLPAILSAEFEAGKRDPYRRVARLLHVVGEKFV